jgi:hypothetical protein
VLVGWLGGFEEGGSLASYHAIAAVGQSIIGLLRAARPPDEFSNADFRLFQARDFEKGLDEGVSLYLYRVIISQARRRLPARQTPTGKMLRPPLPLDLYFILTPWARTPEMQHVLLGWSMRIIEDTPTLPTGLLNSQSPDTFREDEAVEIVHDALSVQDLTNIWTNIWEAAKPNVQVSAAYLARVIAIDSLIETGEDAGPVQTREFVEGKATG